VRTNLIAAPYGESASVRRWDTAAVIDAAEHTLAIVLP
jgi:hypothetical protein